MPHEPKHTLGWLDFPINEAEENEARAMRAERDRQYTNIYNEQATDERWVGDLGEMIFDRWLKLNNVCADWFTSDAAGRPDFVLAGGAKIGIKTIKRQVAPRKHYTAQVTARHANEDVDHFVFMTYEIQARRMWLLGGIARSLFKKQARYYKGEEWVHPRYQVRLGHEIYNIEFSRLIAPEPWLRSVAESNRS